MGEITRQELDAKMDAIKSWGDARFAEQRGYTDTRFAEQRAYIDARFAEQDVRIEKGFAEQRAYIDKRFAEQDVRIEKGFAEQRAYIDKRFAEQEVRIEKGFAEQKAYIDKRFAQIDVLFAQFDSRLHKLQADMLKWFIGVSLVLFAATLTVMGMMLNVAVNALTAIPADDSSVSNTPAHYAPARSLHRFQRHLQARAGGRDTRRYELHAGVAQVFHPK